MLFNSPIFLFAFLPLSLFIYLLIPKKTKNLFLALASIIFYWWGEPNFIKFIFLTITFNFFFAQLISSYSRVRHKAKLFLFVGLTVNLIFLAYFKYFDFFFQNTFLLFPQLKFELTTSVLPLAISFFVFHVISYLVDVYRKKIAPETNFLRLSLYFLLFPHLLAGPIVRLSQISKLIKSRVSTLDNLSYGIIRFIIGLAKKVLIADTLAPTVDEIFATPADGLMPTSALLGIAAYTLQIYFDFSGYSDMAIGLALMFGFKFPENFNYPYASRTLREFWTRWHITLSKWFRDYLFIPLGGNRNTSMRTYLNLLIVFLLVGLWHGAGWNFIIWGLYQGLFLILERLGFVNKILQRFSLPKILGHVYLLVLVMIGWIFFRSDNISYALSFINQILHLLENSFYLDTYHPTQYFLKGDIILALFVGSLLCFPSPISKLLTNKDTASQIVFLALLFSLFILSIICLSAQTYNPFIYFRF